MKGSTRGGAALSNGPSSLPVNRAAPGTLNKHNEIQQRHILDMMFKVMD
jgi:hypothetical protein